ncbi:MAG: hypothetical protein P4L22_07825 [Candidatus Babeliales bacterium]|nr:hypothetical protein [Candidatus Babeliales bacterium]
MKYLVIILSLISVYNIQTSDSGLVSAPASNSSNVSSGSGGRRFASAMGVTASSTSRRFKPTQIARTGYVPITTSIGTSKSVTKTAPKVFQKSGPVSKNPKIYFKSSVPDLVINWVDDNGNTTSTTNVPKDSDSYIQVPDNINYFDITNNTETLKSEKLKVADKTVYTISCIHLSQRDNCLELQIESSTKEVIKKSLSTNSVSKEEDLPKIPKGSHIVYIDNHTGKLLQISWLTISGDLISSPASITMLQGKKQYEKPKNAAKFKIGRDMSMYSNTVDALHNNEYAVTCQPSNYSCKEIVIKKLGIHKESDKDLKNDNKTPSTTTDVLSIYLVNKSKQLLQINWYDINGKLITTQDIGNNTSHQAIKVVPNAINFIISNKQNTLNSLPVSKTNENIYTISCVMINNKCAQLKVVDSGPFITTSGNSSSINAKKPAPTVAATKSAAITRAIPVIASRMGGGDSVDYSAGIQGLDTMLPDYSSGSSDSNSGGSSSSSGSTDSSSSSSSSSSGSSSNGSTSSDSYSEDLG